MVPSTARARARSPAVFLVAALAFGSALPWLACSPGRSPDRSPFSTWREPVTGMEFLYVPPGRFRMGSDPAVAGRQEDETPHPVEITRGFFLGRYQVTQQEWVEVTGENPSHFTDCGPRCPVETVSFHDVQEFIWRLAARSPGSRFRLPTEAEWEMACRAGTDTPFSTGPGLTAGQASFDARYPYRSPVQGAGGEPGRYRGSPAPVGSYPANPWGFHDLHGNVWEWCRDRYGPYPEGTVRDPAGPDAGPLRVIRGGSWYFDGNSARCALRYTHAPHLDGFGLGFRLVREPVRPRGAGRSTPPPRR